MFLSYIKTIKNTLNYVFDKKLFAYLNGLEYIVFASYHWQKFTERYIHPDHFFKDFQ